MILKRILTQVLLLSFISIGLFATENSCLPCQKPFLKNFSDYSTTSVLMQWFDNNSTAQLWEVELVPIGQMRTGTPTDSGILEKEFRFIDLLPSTSYEVWLRTVCDNGDSGWNGPFNFNTNIANGSACDISILLKDDNCNNPEDYRIDVTATSGNALGQNIFIEEINFVVRHEWPSDLRMTLTSPNGKSVKLIEHRGIGYKHYGEPDSLNCASFLSFTNEACNEISTYTTGPLVGSFKPEEDINIFLDGSDPMGTWVLSVCDRAAQDRGTIQFVEIIFSQEVCPIPSLITIRDIDATSVKAIWNAPFNCNVLQAQWGLKGFDPNTGVAAFVPCQSEFLDITDLMPGTDYELYIKSQCNQGDSPFSCAIAFTTACAQITEIENFDNQLPCNQSCSDPCAILGNWYNDLTDTHDWIVNRGSTPSSFTGPQDDPFLDGNYLYIENSASNCPDLSPATLESNCLHVQSNGVCDFSFMYHMFGTNVANLLLEASTDNGNTWNQLYSVQGNQMDRWHRQDIDLSPFQNELIKLRFTALSGNGTAGDIAIDQIEFYGSTFVQEGQKVYADLDLDSFGAGDSLFYCGQSIPSGFSFNNLDCNDADASINPDATELPCNLIDENCNGPDDDPIQNDPIDYIVGSTTDESCAGASDGSIALDIFGGTAPYNVDWNNQQIGATIGNLKEGIYFATITDATGCKTQTKFIEVDANAVINLFTASIISPNCEGIDNGSISIMTNGGTPPYTYLWDNGEITPIAKQLSVGAHQVTVTDDNQCSMVSDVITLSEMEGIEAGVQLKIDVKCYGGNNGSILLSATNGSTPYSYAWSNGDTTSLISDLSAGYFDCTITDAVGCTSILQDIHVTEPDSINIFIDGVENVRCNGDEDGRIEISVVGGNGPYTYFWNTGAFTDDLFGLDTGIYSVVVTDIQGCAASLDSIIVATSDPITVNIDSISHVDCPFSTNGYIALDVMGGTGAFNFFWEIPGALDSFVDNLGSGTYGLTIIDDHNCKATPTPIDIIEINAPLDVSLSIHENNLCFGDSTGQLITSVISDRSPFDFNWSAGIQHIQSGTMDSLKNLPDGSYNVTITDSEGCFGTSDTLVIISPPQLAFSIEAINDEKCVGTEDGSITIDIFGGTEPYNLLWNNTMTDTTIINLTPGNYSFEIIDANLCSLESQSIEIHPAIPLALDAIITAETNSNDNGSIHLMVSGGEPDITYAWSTNAMTGNEDLAQNLTSDTYTITITDANDCTIDSSFFVDNISSLSNLNPVSFSLHNNLSLDYLVLHMEGVPQMDIVYSIMAINGQQVSSKNVNVKKGNTFIPTVTLPSGMLFLVLKWSDGIKTFPFFKGK